MKVKKWQSDRCESIVGGRVAKRQLRRRSSCGELKVRMMRQKKEMYILFGFGMWMEDGKAFEMSKKDEQSLQKNHDECRQKWRKVRRRNVGHWTKKCLGWFRQQWRPSIGLRVWHHKMMELSHRWKHGVLKDFVRRFHQLGPLFTFVPVSGDSLFAM